MAKPCLKKIVQQPLIGVLDGHTPWGNAPPSDFRIVLNTSMHQEDKFSRRPGWQGLMRDAPSFLGDPGNRGNRDLHDQLLKKADHTVTTPIAEPIILHCQYRSDCQAYGFVACTRSRIYTDTGNSANWRILADNLGPQDQNLYTLKDGDTFYTDEHGDRYQAFGETRWMSAQLGNVMFFTNDYDPVMGWKIGDGPTDPESGDNDEECYKAQSALPIKQLVDIGIIRAGVVCEWSGFVFIADTETWLGRECETLYWSDFNDPLSWIPGGESAAGFMSFGRGEKILRIEPLAGQLRIYTIAAIYNVTLTGGDEIFRFSEIYRGPDALAYRWGFVNLGDSHVFLATGGIVELTPFDPRPIRIPWAHKAGGVITQGMDGKLLNDYPGPFGGFPALNKMRCEQITAGYDKCRKEIWFSWPTLGVDNSDCEKVLRMSLVLSRLYRHASVVDHGFSSFCNFVPRSFTSVTNWMKMVSGCTDSVLNQFAPPWCKTGDPFNNPPTALPPPTSIVNPPSYDNPEGNDPEAPIDPDSLCAMYGKEDILNMCSPCEEPCCFSMASLKDFCLKEQVDNLRLREVYVGPPSRA